MKKICLLLSLLLLLAACKRNESALTLERAEALTQSGGFVRADDDFIDTNFGKPSYLKGAAVYLSEKNDGIEYGFFELTDVQYREEMITAIQDYLASEEQSVRALAALYPAEDLQIRLNRFDRATVGHQNQVVYYFLTDDNTAFTKLISEKEEP